MILIVLIVIELQPLLFNPPLICYVIGIHSEFYLDSPHHRTWYKLKCLLKCTLCTLSLLVLLAPYFVLSLSIYLMIYLSFSFSQSLCRLWMRLRSVPPRRMNYQTNGLKWLVLTLSPSNTQSCRGLGEYTKQE